MIISYTKETAQIFNFEAKISASDKFLDISALDDWTMGTLWNTPKHIGLCLIHRSSLFSLMINSEVKDHAYCLSLFNKQLNTLLDESGLSNTKYKDYFERLFSHILLFKHKDAAISNAIKIVLEHLDIYKEINPNQKMKSIDITNFINKRSRIKLDFKIPHNIFMDLVSKHYSDPINYFSQDEILQTLH